MAANFFPDANVPSGECFYPGCTDSTRSNYSPSATFDDGSCAPVFPGCTEPSALNFNAAYTVDDGSCSFGGCTNSTHASFAPRATFDDGSCTL